MKRIPSTLVAAAWLASLTDCSSIPQEETTDCSQPTLIGQVTALEGTTVTLLLGELTETDFTTPENESGTEEEAA